ncbi:SKI/DACH domain-containing protein 1 [Osmerus mordax]|uniref:SKI/DACH domain-containing protein 1 n=1 Tax=Osmerus mordax TaxID=8014 RepID=UPI003510A41E
MGDLKCGFEEMEGVKLGYLLIKGKQMFALSQVFTDLLKNIPRTTVHKRMDHLNVKKHHCDLEELRKLKAINSIAFHAAKCTLISREDVEALYFSCKTERVLKSNKRKVKGSSPGDAREELLHKDTRARSWKEKVWFSLHSVPQTLPLNNKAGSREIPQLPDSNLPQIYNKKHNQEYTSVSQSDYKPFKNYETAQITGNCVSYNQRHSFFRTVVNRQPVFFQSAIAQSKLSGAATDPLHKRKRRREEGGCRDSARRSWSRSRHTHQPPVVLVQPKCCSKPKRHNNESLGAFHLGHEFYLNHGSHHQHHGFQESCSSDTESSSYSERVNNDSDFGSSLSSSSNSGTSDEELEDSPSESSDISTDEESSSQSDSSSVSSLVSVQSIRFRRARFASLPKTKTLNSKTLVLQPTFHYNQQLPPPRTADQVGKADADRLRKHHRHDSVNREAKQDTEVQQTPKFVSPGRGSLFTETVGGDVADVHCDPKSAVPVKTGFYAQGLSSSASRSKIFPPCRTPGAAGGCPPGPGSHCTHLKETKFLKSTDSHLSLAMNLKTETKTGPFLKLPSPLKTIKTEPEESLVSMGPHSESSKAAKTLPSVLQNVKIKVEESSKEYEYSSQASRFQCKGDEADVNNARYPGGDIKHADYFNYKTKAIESSAGAPKSPSLQECRSTQDAPCPEEGEYKNGARVRKNYRTLVLGEKTGISRTQTKPNTSKVDKTPCSRPAGKAESSEGYAEELTGASKRKRTTSADGDNVCCEHHH